MIKKSCEIMQLSNKIILSIMFYLLTFLNAKEWVDTGSQLPSSPVWNLEENSEGNIEIIFDFGGYFLSQLESGQTVRQARCHRRLGRPKQSFSRRAGYQTMHHQLETLSNHAD